MEARRASTLPAKLPRSSGIETSLIEGGKYEPAIVKVDDEEAAKTLDLFPFVDIFLMVF